MAVLLGVVHAMGTFGDGDRLERNIMSPVVRDFRPLGCGGGQGDAYRSRRHVKKKALVLD